MMFEPAETAGTHKPCILALIIGAATIIYALIRDVQAVQAVQAGEAVVKSIPLAITSSLPWLGAGIVLVVRSVRGALPWPGAIASWAGGFFFGMIGLVAGVSFLGGPSDSTAWLLHTLGFVLFLIMGILLLKIAFKRN
jgi:hypothetical protein